jgi:hypothetical protein
MILRTKSVHGFKTGDMVQAEAPKVPAKVCRSARVAVRESGSFNIGKAQSINWTHCRLLDVSTGTASRCRLRRLRRLDGPILTVGLRRTVAIGRV